jgi:hypothetical protein
LSASALVGRVAASVMAAREETCLSFHGRRTNLSSPLSCKLEIKPLSALTKYCMGVVEPGTEILMVKRVRYSVFKQLLLLVTVSSSSSISTSSSIGARCRRLEYGLFVRPAGTRIRVQSLNLCRGRLVGGSPGVLVVVVSGAVATGVSAAGVVAVGAVVTGKAVAGAAAAGVVAAGGSAASGAVEVVPDGSASVDAVIAVFVVSMVGLWVTTSGAGDGEGGTGFVIVKKRGQFAN